MRHVLKVHGMLCLFEHEVCQETTWHALLINQLCLEQQYKKTAQKHFASLSKNTEKENEKTRSW